MAMTGFVPSDNLDKVLALVGNLKKEQGMHLADDGVSQRVTVQTGVATVGEVTVKNPVTLTPYRTFREVRQPSSPFVLRVNADGEAALFTGDDAAWKLEAVRNVTEYLREALEGCNVVVIG